MAKVSVAISLVATLCFGASAARAQGYPERTVELVNPYPPGGATDIMGRVLMEGLAAQLGQRFVFVNKPGANGGIGTAAVARAAPDGYSLLFTAAVSMVVNPLTQAQAGYTLKSFEHICQTFKNEMVIVAHPDSLIKTVADLMRAAKEKPGELSYGILGIGSIPHLAMVELSNVANVKFNAVPFKLGYVPLSQTGAELLFEVFSQRYERGSTVVTSNLPFDEWTSVFGSERLTGALLDRLTHHVHILQLNGDSYRLNQSKRRSRRPGSDTPADQPTQPDA